jgi:hypothetical protein
MTWFMYHQRATDIIAERQREADQIRLAHLARLAEEGRSPAAPHATLAGPRHAVAGVILAVGRSVTRLAETLDVETDAACETA